MPNFDRGDGPLARVELLLRELQDAIADLNIPQQAQDKLTEARQIIDKYDDYLEEVSTPVPKEVLQIIADSDAEDWEAVYQRGETKFPLVRQMTAGAYEASVMMRLVQISGASHILEIGVFTGGTTAALASLPQVKRIVALDIEPFLEKWNQPRWENMGVAEKIDFRIADGQESLKKLGAASEKFDIIFIDADKPGYAAYYTLCLKHALLSPNGYIVADNTAYRGAPWAPSDKWGGNNGPAIADFNKMVRADDRVDVVLLPIRDGMTIIKPKY